MRSVLAAVLAGILGAAGAQAAQSLDDFREPGDRGQIELLASSWIPGTLGLEMPSKQIVPLTRARLPSIAAGYLTTPHQGALGSLSLGMGLRFTALERPGASQAAYIASPEARLVARPSLLAVGPLQAEIALSFLPTLVAVTASAAEREQSAVGVMVAGQGILTYSFPFWKGVQLRLGVEQTLGAVGYERRISSKEVETVFWDLSGLGANLGLRFPL